MSGQVYSSSQFSAYAAAIRQGESTDNYQSVSTTNGLSFYGAYQLGTSALTDAGFLDAQGNWTSFAESLGVASFSTFLSTPSAQDIAFQNFTEKNFEYLHNYQSYVGKTVGGVFITEAGLLAGAHLVGQSAVKTFLNTNGATIPADANGVPVTQYLTKFSNYYFTFPANSSGFSPANTPSTLAPDQQATPQGNIAITSGANALDGKTPVERLRHYAAQARADAARHPAPAHMKLHDMLMKLSPQLPSVAPIPGRAGQRQTALPPRDGISDAAGLSGISRPPGAAASLTTGTAAGQGAALTGYRKIIADAHVQAAEARAKRNAGRAAMGLASHGGDLSSRSFAPVGGLGAVGRFANAMSGGALEQDQMAAGQLPSHGSADALYPRPQPQRNGDADSALSGVQPSPASLSPSNFERALDRYFFRLSRLPPSGGAAFNPYLSPVWAGLKLPG